MDKYFVKQDELENIRKKYKAAKIVLTSGCFDLIHQGHIKHLQEAKKQGDILIVAVNSDYSIRRLKGKGKPILNEEQRLTIIASIRFVDYVYLFDSSNVVDSINMLKPDVFVIGQESVVLFPEEVNSAKECGCKIHVVKRINSYSSSNIIKKIKTEVKIEN